MAIDSRTWKVGELARETGLTVRALHHYEQRGLLRPPARTEAGYRLYAAEDVERLYRILALRQLGVSLQEIGDVMRGEGDLGSLLARQQQAVAIQLELYRTLQWKLGQLVKALGDDGNRTERFIETMEAITKMDKYFTPEQQAELAARQEALGPGGMQKAEKDWVDLIRDVRTEIDAGTSPEDVRIAPLAERWRNLVHAFTGGNLGIAKGVAQQYKDRGVEATSQGVTDAKTMEFMSVAMQHHGGW